MKKKSPQNQTFDFALVEKWLESYFLDPLTSYYDQTQFQIDLFETDQEWIVEANLSDFKASDIRIYIEYKKLTVSARPPSRTHLKRSRSIEFPFNITEQDISAAFSNGILEIFISKTKKGSGKNRYITVP
ncbi:Hsp20/alpha crystallin family protein [Neobacillus cucumis]|uniref:Hsp20/alpha crystallin family protein n=1 Tax=Neobacillus cucumis TaxID=1740721 RepID=UPI0028537441|nr:Hsp20/alpha crystallin family protein [Neobacillus cucumis]MDR4947454.1 Hsp20/alpha crystallin family protein [Neobacillus cucumis]